MVKNYSEDLKKFVFGLKSRNKSCKEIFKITSIPLSSVYFIFKKYEEDTLQQESKFWAVKYREKHILTFC